ncbi:MAG: TM0106 family RecB-like putative nuclease [Candidatus Marinimicrobia bacterium]|nr:TM0106 family RecB-like putative nuclease [Candidatus Neomarinimicrobiota bacterium]
MPFITASKLYDFLQCPHRVWRDEYGPKEEKSEEVNAFVQMLWDQGVSYEEKVVSELGDFLDLSAEGLSMEERFERTIKAMKEGVPLIYQGVLIQDNLRGIPDLLRRVSDGQYIPIDIKSGMGRENVDMENGKSGKLKKNYAVQLALYCDALNRLGFENNKIGIIHDIKGNEVVYDLNLPVGVVDKTTFWEFYEKTKEEVLALLQNQIRNKPAMAGICKLCPWYESCKKWVEDRDDLTGLFYLGRKNRDVIAEDTGIKRIGDLASADVEELMDMKKRDKSFLKGVGRKTFEKIVARANILSVTKQPVVYSDVRFPNVSYELFFDIEDDPTKEFIYLHGVYERSKNGERFLDFTARDITVDEEKRAWKEFWDYIRSLPKDDFAVYYYSPHERVTYQRMQINYPDIVSEEEVNEFFNNPNVIDLYQIVLKNTDWPLGSYSLKAIAQYLGFKWRDETPSGALSIQWFNDYLNTRDEKILERILLYNEDDCKATMVLKDAIKKISDLSTNDQ